MSKMGSVIMEIQSLAAQGIPDKEIAKYTDTSIEFVQDVVKDFLNPGYDDPYYYEGGCCQQ